MKVILAEDVVNGFSIDISYIDKYKEISTYSFLNDVDVKWIKKLFGKKLLKMGQNLIDFNDKKLINKFKKCKINTEKTLITDKYTLPDISSYVSDSRKFELKLWEI